MTDSDESQERADDSVPAASDEPAVSDAARAIGAQRKRVLVVFAATFGCAAVLVAAGLLAAGRGDGTAAGGATTLAGSTASTSASPGHTAPARTLTPAKTPEDVATSVQIPAKLKATLRSWNHGNGGKDLAMVSNELGTALQAGGVKQYVSMRAACTSLSTAIDAARTGPPIPNGAVQKRYSTALSQVAGAAAQCHAAISERVDGDETVATYENQVLFHKAEVEFSIGVRDLYSVTAEVANAGK